MFIANVNLTSRGRRADADIDRECFPFIQGSYVKGTDLCPDVDIDRCSLHSGVQINVYYMTGLCPDVHIDHKI